KAEEIRRVLSEPEVDLWKLRELALTEGGLVNDSLRKLAWPKLVGVSNDGHDHIPIPPTNEVTIPNSLDWEQIDRDVARVTWHLLTGNQRALLKKKQRRLGDFLNLVLLEEEDRLRYYQGFHDIATNTAASSMGLTLASQVLRQLSHSHFRDAMRSNFNQLNAALRLVIMPLTAAFDSELHSHLYDCEMEPFFALSWIITWFSHDVRDTAVVKRLFDFFLVSHPLMSVYMSVAMMIHPLNRIEILGTDCDFACVHNALADLP
ncbi:hypothetical protein THAPSDRAFT_262611, partial [Thalassiosira pseudonana CCMP1335]